MKNTNKVHSKKCSHCGQLFFRDVVRYTPKRFKTMRYCSKVCGLHGRKGEVRQARGDKHPHWKGGKRLAYSGYYLIHQPRHPYCQSHGYVLEHRLVMEKHLGRYLEPDEVVHHINEIKTDNRLENLQLTTKSDHAKMHFTYRPKGPDGKLLPKD